MNEADARKYMKLAVEEMGKSVPEPRKDGKLTPKVGAVLVLPTGEVVTAHRGELRNGDHAEFTLLERKCRDRNIAGSALFVTLEPCADGARKEPKRACARRVVAARIKEVWVGREDPYPTVATKGIAYLKEMGVEVNLFDGDLQDEISRENDDFIKKAEEAAAIYEEDKPPQGLSRSALDDVSRATFGDLSPTALTAYKKKLGIESDAQLERTLSDEGLLVEEDGELRPTGFCTLLFGSNPRSRYPQAGVMATIEYAGGGEELEDFEGPLIEIPDKVEAWLKDKLPNLINRNQMTRTEGENLPLAPIREGLVNALIHRDYDIEGAKVQLKITPDAFSIQSPGKPISPITVEKMASFTASTLSRNPKLHYVFKQMNLAEERNRGMKTLRDLQDEGDLVPTVIFDDPYLTLALHTNPESAANEIAGTSVTDQLTPEEREGLHTLFSRRHLSAAEYAKELGVTTRTAQRHLGRFVQLGLASRKGAGPSTRYIIRGVVAAPVSDSSDDQV
jgi:ATP-dependent DNA helicase RecG